MRLKRILKSFVAETLAVVLAFGTFAMVPAFTANAGTTLDTTLEAPEKQDTIKNDENSDCYFVDVPMHLSDAYSDIADTSKTITITKIPNIRLVAYASLQLVGITNENENVNIGNSKDVAVAVTNTTVTIYCGVGNDNSPQTWDCTPSVAGEYKSLQVLATLKRSDEISVGNAYAITLPDTETTIINNQITELTVDPTPEKGLLDKETVFNCEVTDGWAKLKNNDTQKPTVKLTDDDKNVTTEPSTFSLNDNKLTTSITHTFNELGTYNLTAKCYDKYESAEDYVVGTPLSYEITEKQNVIIDPIKSKLAVPTRANFHKNNKTGYFVNVPMQFSAESSLAFGAKESKKVVVKGSNSEIKNITTEGSYAKINVRTKKEPADEILTSKNCKITDVQTSNGITTVTIDCGINADTDQSEEWSYIPEKPSENGVLNYNVTLYPSKVSNQAIPATNSIQLTDEGIKINSQITESECSMSKSEVVKGEKPTFDISIKDGWEGLWETNANPQVALFEDMGAEIQPKKIGTADLKADSTGDLAASIPLFGENGATINDVGTHNYYANIVYGENQIVAGNVEDLNCKVVAPEINMYAAPLSNREIQNAYTGQTVVFRVNGLPDGYRVEGFQVDKNTQIAVNDNNEYEFIAYKGDRTATAHIDNSTPEGLNLTFEFNVCDIYGSYQLDKTNVATGASASVNRIYDEKNNMVDLEDLYDSSFKLVAVPLDSQGNPDWGRDDWTIAKDWSTLVDINAPFSFSQIYSLDDLKFYPRAEGRYRLYLDMKCAGSEQVTSFAQDISCYKDAPGGTDWKYDGIYIQMAETSINVHTIVYNNNLDYKYVEKPSKANIVYNNNLDYKYVVKPGKANEDWAGWYVAKPFTTKLYSFNMELKPGTYTIYVDVRDDHGNIVTKYQEVTITMIGNDLWCYSGVECEDPVGQSGGKIFVATRANTSASNITIMDGLKYKYVVKPGKADEGWDGWWIASKIPKQLGQDGFVENSGYNIEFENYGTYTIYVDVKDSNGNEVTMTKEITINKPID